ncbi:MAG: 6,7-dimethyl-8-ribityllumazine synthase [Verrucomicrobia bacterium]|nr:6,7-dimethyl-8-ribityllumazine synthase [Verrucomicrobiota bacterium]
MSKAFPTAPRMHMRSGRAFGIVASRFNQSFVQSLVDHTQAELSQLEEGAPISLVWTPGSFEIPLFVQSMAELKKFHAIIALGVILEGETAHARLIADAVTRSLLDISLAHRVPVIHEVLLVRDKIQAEERCMHAHNNRGTQAARAAAMAARQLAAIA